VDHSADKLLLCWLFGNVHFLSRAGQLLGQFRWALATFQYTEVIALQVLLMDKSCYDSCASIRIENRSQLTVRKLVWSYLPRLFG